MMLNGNSKYHRIKTHYDYSQLFYITVWVCYLVLMPPSRKAIRSLQEEGDFCFGGIEKTTLEW